MILMSKASGAGCSAKEDFAIFPAGVELGVCARVNLNIRRFFKSECTEISSKERPQSQINLPSFCVYREVLTSFLRFRGLFYFF